MRLALLILVAVLSACSGPYSEKTVSARQEDPPPQVDIALVEQRNIPEVITATGELFAEERATISTKVAGRLRVLRVDIGTRVAQGDVLAELEREDYEIAVRQAEALVEQTRARLGLGPNDSDNINPEDTAIVRQAHAELVEAQFIFDTTSKLFEDGVVSNVDYQKSRVRLDGIKARRQAAVEEVFRTRAELLERKARLALSRQHLEDTVIRAPFAGAITRRIASIGEYLPVNAGICELVRTNPIRIRLSVPERQAAKVRIGQRIDLQLAGAQQQHSGRIVRISPAIDAQNRSLLVEGELPNTNGELRAGAFAEASITVRPNATGIAVPRRAVVSFAGVDRVFLAADGKLEERIIQIGRPVSETEVEVLNGLEPGRNLVLNPSDRFTDGLAVTVRERRPS